MIREKMHNIARTLRTIHTLNRSTLPLHTLQAILDAVLPTATLVIAARVVGGLEMGLSAQALITIALLGSVLIFLLACASHLLERYRRVHYNSHFLEFAFTKSRKALAMDYQELDSENTRNIRDRINTDNSWGDGIGSPLAAYRSIVQHGALSIVSAVIVAPLFASLRGSAGAGWTAVFFTGVAALTVGSIAYVNAEQKRGWAMLNQWAEHLRMFWVLIAEGIRTPHGKDIRIYGVQELIRERGGKEMARMMDGMGGRPALRFGRGSGISAAVSGAIQGGAYLYVGLQALSGALDIGSVFLYAGAIHQFSLGLSQLLRVGGEFLNACERMRSTYDFLDIPDTLYKGTIPVERRRDNDYVIEFHDVSFRYPGSEAWALRNLNMKLRVGERMAVVGRNGSGKTTMIKLLCRLYDPTEGVITLNGVDIRKYDYSAYLRLFSVVFQDFQLYAFPLGQNVAASTKVDEARAQDALDQAGFTERLQTMGLGCSLYKDFDDAGVEISGGEAQKIALARALYKGAPFVILDEPTAALDPIAEFEIYSRFDGIVGQRTAVYISHRLSSCRFCQDIAVFHEGRLVQRGSHDDLLADQAGPYCELWTAQAQYYQDRQQSA